MRHVLQDELNNVWMPNDLFAYIATSMSDMCQAKTGYVRLNSCPGCYFLSNRLVKTNRFSSNRLFPVWDSDASQPHRTGSSDGFRVEMVVLQRTENGGQNTEDLRFLRIVIPRSALWAWMGWTTVYYHQLGYTCLYSQRDDRSYVIMNMTHAFE